MTVKRQRPSCRTYSKPADRHVQVKCFNFMLTSNFAWRPRSIAQGSTKRSEMHHLLHCESSGRRRQRNNSGGNARREQGPPARTNFPTASAQSSYSNLISWEMKHRDNIMPCLRLRQNVAKASSCRLGQPLLVMLSRQKDGLRVHPAELRC